VARNAIRWTYETLNKENREWLAALPAGPLIVDDMIEICHGTPFDEDAYVFDDLDALRAMHAARRPLCLFGHTHVQVGHYLSHDQFGLATADDYRPLGIPLDDANRYLVNPKDLNAFEDGAQLGLGIGDFAGQEHLHIHLLSRAEHSKHAVGIGHVHGNRAHSRGDTCCAVLSC